MFAWSSGDQVLYIKELKERTNEKLKDMKLVFRIMKYYKKYWKHVIIVQLISLIRTSLNLAFPYMYGKILDSITKSETQENLNNIAFIYIISILGSSILLGISGIINHHLTSREDFTGEIYESILYKDIGFFEKYQTGELTLRMN